MMNYKETVIRMWKSNWSFRWLHFATFDNEITVTVFTFPYSHKLYKKVGIIRGFPLPYMCLLLELLEIDALRSFFFSQTSQLQWSNIKRKLRKKNKRVGFVYSLLIYAFQTKFDSLEIVSTFELYVNSILKLSSFRDLSGHAFDDFTSKLNSGVWRI